MRDKPPRRLTAIAVTAVTTAALGVAGVVVAQQASAATIDLSANYVLQNANSGQALEIWEWSTADGGNAVQFTDLNEANQQWQLIKIGSSGGGNGGGGTGPTTPWPSETGSVKVNSTIAVSGSLDGGNKRCYGIGDGGRSESQDPMFKLASGATLSNVIIGAPAGGGARSASDKVFQHNGGGTLTIQNFQVSNFGKLYRSCGNCSTQYKRTVVISNIRATAPGTSIAGINTNYGDTATLRNITVVGDSSKKIAICDRYTGNSSGDEPKKTGSGPDGTYCKYSTSDIIYS